ncbi:hypothetical protein [Nocardia thraciensis]
MPDEYDNVRRNLSNYERGLYFELGRAQIRGETPEKGWVRQFEIRVGEDQQRRRLDSARTEGRGVRAVERKSGQVNEREARGQIGVERSALDSGQVTHSTWETVEGEKVPEKVLGDMQDMSRDFPGKFHHEIVSRADALRAIQLKKSLAGQQLELIDAYKLDRAERARKRLEGLREIERQKEARAKEGRERAEREAREQRTRAEREAKIREARTRAAREAALESRPSENCWHATGNRRQRRRESEPKQTHPRRHASEKRSQPERRKLARQPTRQHGNSNATQLTDSHKRDGSHAKPRRGASAATWHAKRPTYSGSPSRRQGSNHRPATK